MDISVGLPAEMHFILACMRAFVGAENADAEKPNPPSDEPDWSRLLAYARKHRLIALLGQVVSGGTVACPESFLARLKKERERNTQKSLMQVAELQRLSRVFQKQGIDFIVLKGLPLARELYGGIANRTSSDIDLLINQKDTPRAFDCLFDLGYQTKIALPKQAFTTEKGLMARLRYFSAKDVAFLLRDKALCVELHWRVSGCRGSFPVAAEEILGNKRIDEAGVPVMNKELMVLYLCHHGATHCWHRLHWLCDIALLFSHQDIDWDKVLIEAVRLKVLHLLGMAVVLVRDVLQLPVPAVLANDAKLNALGVRLVNKMPPAIYQKEDNCGFDKGTQYFFWNLGLQASNANRLQIILRQLCPSDNSREFMPLPDGLALLYIILHPLRLFGKMIGLPIR